MKVLLVTTQETDAGATGALGAAWTAAAPRCVVETLVVPAVATSGADPADGAPAGRGSAPAGVFVPTSALGLRRAGGAETVPPHLADLHDGAAAADVVVVHCAVVDAAALHEGPPAVAARAAAPHAVPVVVLAGRDRTTRRELAGAGVSAVHVVGDPWDPALVARAARTWAPSWAGGSP